MKSKRTKACEIPQKVKRRVWERDRHCCVLCGRPGNPDAHFIPRSHNGKGIEENIVTLCPECHRDYDNSERRPELKKGPSRLPHGKVPRLGRGKAEIP